jgi:hypothetical protein
MSLIETVTENKGIHVDSQYESSNTSISSNQCSWCAYEFARYAQKFRTLWLSRNYVEFQKQYNACVLEGSKKRKQCNKYTCGENIDDPDILKEYSNIINVDEGKTILNEDGKTILELLPDELRTVFFLRNDTTTKSMEHLVMRLTMNTMKGVLIVNRFGQSFTIIPLLNGTYLIMDSHCRSSGSATLENVIKYLTINNDNGYNLILWRWGYVSENKYVEVGSTLEESTLQGSTLQESTLQGSTLQGSTLAGTGTTVQGSTLAGAGTTVQGSTREEASI